MKLLAFLDIICCALLSSIIVFKLQSGSGRQPARSGKVGCVLLTVKNPWGEAGPLELLMNSDGAGGSRGHLRLEEAFVGDLVSLGPDLMLRLPDVSEVGREFSMMLFGEFVPGSTWSGSIRQQTSGSPKVRDLEDAVRGGLDVLGDAYSTSGLRELSKSNQRFISEFLVGAPKDAPWSSRPRSNPEVEAWLYANLLALETMKILSDGSMGRTNAVASARNALARRDPDDTYAAVTHEELLLSALDGTLKAVAHSGRPSAAALQEIALNWCSVRRLCGEDASRKACFEFFKKGRWRQVLPEGRELRIDAAGDVNGLVPPGELHNHVLLFLESVEAGWGAEILGEHGSIPTVWETFWRPIASEPSVRYELAWSPTERSGRLLEGLEESRAAGHLGDIGRGAFPESKDAHGSLFYDFILNSLRGARIEGMLVWGSEQSRLGAEEFDIDADNSGSVTFRFRIPIPHR